MKKNILALLCVATITATSTVPACAFDFSSIFSKRSETRASLNSEDREAREKNTVIGKIQNISAESVTIEVATRKERGERSEKIENGEKPEGNSENRERRENFNEENMFNFTGEIKTIDISSADLGRKRLADDDSEEGKGEKLTVNDYNVGDMIRITLDSEGSNKAKRMRSAGFGSNRERIGGYEGKYQGKYKENKNASDEQ